MCSDTVIAVRNASKVYRAYAHPMHALLARASGDRWGRHKEFSALHDISFEVRRGESVGIVGRNGSGKSTLLQLICGIRQPTKGSIEVRGRISALLELGSGFHPDFTGRENVFMQGAIIGLGREEMESRFDRIAAFADIGEYLDQPVKTYSTGMTVRLAFAVAVCVDPGILVVDEALAVGDTAFQVKCMNRMQELIDAGVTMLFVSHNAYQVQRMCSRALYLAGGGLRMLGSPYDVLSRYESDIACDMQPEKKEGILNASFRFVNAVCETANRSPTQGSPRLGEGQPFSLVIDYVVANDLHSGLQIGVLLRSIDGARVFGEMSQNAGVKLAASCGSHQVRIDFIPNLLLPGNYSFSLSAFDDEYIEQYGFHENVATLSIDEGQADPLQRIGMVALPRQWHVSPYQPQTLSRRLEP